MSFTSDAYTTVAEVKEAVGSTTPATRDDSFIAGLIAEAQADIDSELGYSFQTDGPGATRVYSGNDALQLLVDRMPTAPTQVLEQTWNVTVGQFGGYVVQLGASTDITADIALGPDPNFPPYFLLERLSGLRFGGGRNNYKLTGTFGVTPVPADIRRATLRLAIHYLKMRDANYAQSVKMAGGMGSTKYSFDWPEDVARIVEKHRRRSFFTTGR